MSTNELTKETPSGTLSGFSKFFKEDILSGLLVFLIALPLCLAISIASGFPPIAGIFTAICGAVLTTFISNSELTIKGPAAGMIVIVLGCIQDFGGNGMMEGWTSVDAGAYRAALAVGVVAAVLQICFGVFRAGILGEFFPSAVVHGMLAAIGVIIMIKQIPVAMGVTGATGEPLHMLYEMPRYAMEANPAILAIGAVSLLIMFLWPLVRERVKFLSPIPAPLVVLLVAIPMGMGFNLIEGHPYTLLGHTYQLGSNYLVAMPDRVFGMFDFITTPDFNALKSLVAWKWVLMFFSIGTLESLLSAKAIDLIDPYKRKTNMNRDVLAVGVANLAASSIGGLPMISEIVRSRANIDNGAKTRFANFWHGLFLLLCVALIPMILHRIPLAALAAMLVYTGSRLAHPKEFINVYRIGIEQLLIFVTTMVMVLATDLLVGVAAGIFLKIIIHVINGVPLKSIFMPYLEVQEVDSKTSLIIARESAVFSNWIPFRRQIEEIGLVQHRNVIVDVSDTKLVDLSVIDKLEEMKLDFAQEGLTFEVRGLDDLKPLSGGLHSARYPGLVSVKRITLVVEEGLENMLLKAIIECGASGYTTFPCAGAGRREVLETGITKFPYVRIEVVATPQISEAIITYLRKEITPNHRVTACVETVDVVNAEDFQQLSSE